MSSWDKKPRPDVEPGFLSTNELQTGAQSTDYVVGPERIRATQSDVVLSLRDSSIQRLEEGMRWKHLAREVGRIEEIASRYASLGKR
ncbi:hypothetical protein Ddye_009644 [Dipteronia dyeriana]|uniref:Uncharacterized protein n=1 Tax=Dipteronia dyeriana TaxID=168575 RepID=A0AAE0CMG3_9ROSI|nr:hypothetical protein Ddye_009644 [Dipteronia dyeriana]